MPEIEGREEDRQRQLSGRLTAQEREVLSLLAQGLSAPQIARRLYVSDSAVKRHVRSISNKLAQPDRGDEAGAEEFGPRIGEHSHEDLMRMRAQLRDSTQVALLDGIQVRFGRTRTFEGAVRTAPVELWRLNEMRMVLEALDDLYDQSYRFAEWVVDAIPTSSDESPPRPLVARICQDSPLIIELAAIGASATAFMRVALGFIKYLGDHPDAPETLGAALPRAVKGWMSGWRELRELADEIAVTELPSRGQPPMPKA
jgi:transposase